MVELNAYYLLTIVVIACGSIPKGKSIISFFRPSSYRPDPTQPP